jgi:AraC-like DNA-binding protein
MLLTKKKYERDISLRGRHTRDWAVWAESCPALRTREVLAAGYTELGMGYQILRRFPAFSQLGACVEGQVEYFAGGQWQTSEKGAVLVAPAGAPHGSRRIDARAKPGKTAWVLFDPVVKRSSRFWNRGDSRLLPSRDVRPLWWALQGLYVEANAADASCKTSRAGIGQWCDLVVAAASRLVEDESTGDRAVVDIWEKVDANLARPWSAAQIGAMAGVSETHFRRRCLSAIGRSPGRHLTHLRMQRAALLLATTRDKLRTIAASVGYTDEFAFSVAFKRWNGVAPSEFRDSKRQ